MDVFNIAIQLAFILLFVVVLVRYLRQPRAVHRDLVLVFASVVALFVIAIALAVWPTLPRGLSTLSAVVLLLQPYLTLRLARHFVPVSRNVATGSLIWFGVAVAGLAVGIRGNVLMTGIVIGYFVTVEAIAATFLLRASRARVGYARTRLRIASVTMQGQSARIGLVGEVPLTAVVTLESVTALGLQVGQDVWAAVKATEVRTYPR